MALIQAINDDENRSFQKRTKKEMSAKAPSGSAEKTKEGAIDERKEEYVMGEEDEIGRIADNLRNPLRGTR